MSSGERLVCSESTVSNKLVQHFGRLSRRCCSSAVCQHAFGPSMDNAPRAPLLNVFLVSLSIFFNQSLPWCSPELVAFNWNFKISV